MLCLLFDHLDEQSLSFCNQLARDLKEKPSESMKHLNKQNVISKERRIKQNRKQTREQIKQKKNTKHYLPVCLLSFPSAPQTMSVKVIDTVDQIETAPDLSAYLLN